MMGRALAGTLPRGRARAGAAFWPLLALTLAVYFATEVPGLDRNPVPYGDEAWLMQPGYQVAAHGRLGNPMYGYLEDGIAERLHSHSFYVFYLYLGAFFKALGFGLAQARLAGVVSGALAVVGVALLGRALFTPAVGSLAAVLLALDNGFLGNARVVKGNVLAAALGVWLVLLLWTALARGSAWLWSAAGLAFGLALMTHIKAWYVGLIVVAVWGLGVWRGARPEWRVYAAFGAGAAPVLVPAGWYVATDLANFLAQWRHWLGDYRVQPVDWLTVLSQWNTGLLNWPYPLTSPVRPDASWAFVALVGAGAWRVAGEVSRRERYATSAAYLLLVILSCVVFFLAFVTLRTFMDVVYVSPFLAVVAAASVLPAAPANPGGTSGARWLRRGAMAGAAVCLALGLAQNARYTIWLARADLAPLDELSAVLRRLVPREAKILAIDTLWPAFYDYPVFYAAHAPLETRHLTDDLASGTLGRRRYDVLIVDGFWLASAPSTTPVLLGRFENAREKPPLEAVLHNTRFGDIRIYRLDGSRVPVETPPRVSLYFAGERPGVFKLGRWVAAYGPDELLRLGVPENREVRVAREAKGLRIVTNRSHYDYQLSVPLEGLVSGHAYLVRVALDVEWGRAIVGVEGGGRFLTPAAWVRRGDPVVVRELGGLIAPGGPIRLLVANAAGEQPDESEVVFDRMEVWELAPAELPQP